MAKAPKKDQPALEDVELVPDAWPRFEKFVRDIAKAKPKHKTAEDTYAFREAFHMPRIRRGFCGSGNAMPPDANRRAPALFLEA